MSEIGKSASYTNSGSYNIGSSPSDERGTGWTDKVFDTLGLEYVVNTSTYQHGFKVPFDGIYKIDVIITFRGTAWDAGGSLYGYLRRNGGSAQTVIERGENYHSCTFSFLSAANAGDLLVFTLLQNTGNTVVIDGPSSRFNITYLGK